MLTKNFIKSYLKPYQWGGKLNYLFTFYYPDNLPKIEM